MASSSWQVPHWWSYRTEKADAVAGAPAEAFDVRRAYLVLEVPVVVAAVASWRSPLRRTTDPVPPPEAQVVAG